MTGTPIGASQTYPTYLDVDEQVVPWLQFQGLTLTTQTKAVLQLITDSVCTQAQRFIGGPIGPTQYSPTTGIGMFDGSAGLLSGYIMLPRYPVVTITKLVEYRGGTGVELYEVKPTGTGTPTTTREGTQPGTGFQCNYRTGRLTRVLGGIWNRPWYPGSNNIWVTWTAGYNPIPSDIVRASLEWVAHIYRNTQQARSNGGVRGNGAGQYEPADLPGLWAGMPNRVADTLKTYVHVGVK